VAAVAVGSVWSGVEAAEDSEKLNMAIVGSGGRGRSNLGGVSGENIYALCDVNRQTLEATKKKYPDAKTTTDWRTLVDDPKVDAVVVSTADHHHALAALAAMEAGKHVYCEKPLAHTVQEARWMQDVYASKKDKIATQMGTQIHATPNYRRTVELVQAGAIGAVKEAHVWCGRTIKPVPVIELPKQDVPGWFDWDVWQGPAADRAYNEAYWKGGNLNWNRRWEFGNGVLGDMGSHLIDLPWWALGLSQPNRIESMGPDVDPHVAPSWQAIQWDHADAEVGGGKRGPVKVFWYHGPEGMKLRSERLQAQLGSDTDLTKWHIGVCFVGEKGLLVADYGKHLLSPSGEFKDYKRPEQSIAASAGHYNEWLQACRGKGESLCNFTYSGSLIEHNLLGNLAHRAGGVLEWDAKAFRVTNNEAANKLLSKEYRKGWQRDNA